MTDHNNSGVLSRNDRKQKDTHADFKGNATVDGKAYWIDAWVKESKKDGRKFFSLSFKPREQPKPGGSTVGKYDPLLDDPIDF